MNTENTISEILFRKIKEEKKISQVELAKKMNVSSVAVNKWLSGGSIEVAKIPQLCEILGITPNELFGIDDNLHQALLLYQSYQSHPEYHEAIKKILDIDI